MHHIEEWIRDEGETNLSNLVRLCTYHHHLVYEGGFTLTLDAERVVVRAPGGWLVPFAPPLPPSNPDELIAATTASGSDITSDTLPPDWNGDRLDLDYAVSVLMTAGAA